MVKPEDVLVDCPRNCGYKVKAGKAGEAHRIIDPLNPSKTVWCQ